MSNYNSLKTTIDANIKQNGRQEITGQILNSVLNQMVTTLGAGYQFAGVATIDTNPGTPDAKVFYIANGKGTYTNFGGLIVDEDEVVLLTYDDSWQKLATGIALNIKINELNDFVEKNNEELLAIRGDENKFRPIIIKNEYVVAANGKIASANGWDRTAKLSLKLFKSLTFNISSAYCWVYKSDGTPIVQINTATTPTIHNSSITDADYIIISGERAQMSNLEITTGEPVEASIPSILASIAKDKNDINDDILTLKRINEENLAPVRLIKNSYVSTDGSFLDNQGWSRTDYIYIKGINYMDVRSTQKTGAYCAFYDANKKKVGNNFSISPSTNYVYPPLDAVYMALSAPDEVMKMASVEVLSRQTDMKQLVLSLSNVKSLFIRYHLSRLIPYLPDALFAYFSFDGELEIVSVYTSNRKKYTMQQIYDEVGSPLSYSENMIAIPVGRRLAYNMYSEKMELQFSNAPIPPSSIILLDNWYVEGEHNSVRGYLYDEYVKRSNDKFDIRNYTKEPDFFLQTMIEDKCNDISKEINIDDIFFTMATDGHADPFALTTSHNLYYGIVNKIHEYMEPLFHIELGDETYQGPSFLNKTLGMSNFRAIFGSLQSCKQKYLAVGNHDYNSDARDAGIRMTSNKSFFLSDAEVYNAFGREIDKNKVVWGSKEKMYYYKDYEELKLRLIVLNTTDNETIFNESGELISEEPMIHPMVRQEQLSWYANKALDFSEKGEDKVNWHTIVFCHISFSPNATGNYPYPINGRSRDNSDLPVSGNNALYDITKAFKDGGVVNYNYVDTTFDGRGSATINKDFSTQGKMTLIGVFSGHMHSQQNWDYGDIIFRTLPSGYGNDGSIVAYDINKGVSACAVLLNKTKRTIKLRFFGAGEDLDLTY